MSSMDQIARPAAGPAYEARVGEPALEGAGVWLVIPCYKVRDHILKVIGRTPAWVEGIVCVDDACPDASGDFIAASNTDPRVRVLRLPQNQGVGGATMAGYAEAARLGGRILVKVDGDDQMDLAYLPQLGAPILLGEADYAKGNRFTSISHLQAMPGVRIFGNAGLSFLAKLSTGYWTSFDPTNGFTAIEASVARLVTQKPVARRFFFETDLLYHLGTLRAVVRDVPAPGQAASAGVVMAAALPVIIGVQLLLQAMNFDVLNVPTRPIHPYLRTLERIEAAAQADAATETAA